MIDIKNWKIDIGKLENYQKNGWNDDKFFETENQKYAIYIYNINEWKMCSYNAEFAIYSDRNNNEPLINFKYNTIDFNFKTCFEYAELSDCIILKKQFYQKEINKLSYPFLLIKPSEKKFAFIEWDFTSVYFKLVEVEKNILQLKFEFQNEVERLKLENRENEIFEIENLEWFEIDNLLNSSELYSKLVVK